MGKTNIALLQIKVSDLTKGDMNKDRALNTNVIQIKYVIELHTNTMLTRQTD